VSTVSNASSSKRYEITVDVDRFKPDEIEVLVDDHKNLIIRGHHHEVKNSWHFKRRFKLPDNVHPKQLEVEWHEDLKIMQIYERQDADETTNDKKLLQNHKSVENQANKSTVTNPITIGKNKHVKFDTNNRTNTRYHDVTRQLEERFALPNLEPYCEFCESFSMASHKLTTLEEPRAEARAEAKAKQDHHEKKKHSILYDNCFGCV